jgi:N-acetylglucosamine-6-phosphate deacetylase
VASVTEVGRLFLRDASLCAAGCDDGAVTSRVLLRGLVGEPGAILIDGERIAALGTDATGAAGGGASVVTVDGLRAVPGFVELQINGLDERDFTTDPGAVWQVGERLARHGVTAFLPTIVTSPRGSVEAAMRALATVPDDVDGAVPLGLHVEGPFISPARRGAHDQRYLRAPDLGEIAEWVAGGARLITLAPELPGAIEAIGQIAAAGGVASVGHTDADATTTARAVEAGARYATHLFNAMPALHHRSPGAAAALLADERVTIGLIADGVHLDPLVLRLVQRLASGRVSLVSDAVAHRLASGELRRDTDSARLPDGTLAGSVHQLDYGVRTFAAATGSVESALDAVTATPARLLGLDDGRGMLRVGGRADIVLLTSRLEIAATIVAGRPAYLKDGIAWVSAGGGPR